MPRHTKLILILVSLLTMSFLTACNDFQLPGGSAEAAEPKASTPPKKSLCPKAGPITRSLLPAPDGVERIATNPCLGVNGLLGLVMQHIPDDKLDDGEVKTFRQGVKTFASRVTVAADAVECAYENDHLAVSVYQDPEHAWSLGLVAVVRGDAEALAEDVFCLLLKQVGAEPNNGFAEGPPTPRFCADAESREAKGHNFMILWIADSDRMCQSLTTAIRQV
ncbi:hypothetical protein [Nonomuraea africana]|uniref:DUF3558 domain-containing protein n=1 Tax=Nonomuraea africana TaxID=46171 RepID=A0ABR9KFU6_9ACTN|nr:hypothetical protein [Nonomuraea africana]MBE1560881.1 hypothetical protein [Nonomuraea africana]